MPEFVLDQPLQQATQIQHTAQDLQDLRAVGLQETVNKMSVRDLIRESEEARKRVDPGQREEIEAKVDATVETARQLGDKAKEIIREVGVENLDPDSVEKLVGVFNLSPEERLALIRGIALGDEEAIATFHALLDEAIGDGSDPEKAFAVAAAFTDDPTLSPEQKESLAELAKELVEHIKELRELLEDILLREALEARETFYRDPGEDDNSLLRLILTDDQYEWCLELAEQLGDVITGKAFEDDKRNLSEEMAREREEERLMEAVKNVNEAILTLGYQILLETDPDRVAYLKDQRADFVQAERAVEARLTDVRGRMAA
ncbi:MAG: hypothetical protein KDD55_04670 [Bdellovibrionales bacterium]|nr:hypothetical protein [Bdellovibrionales bacterium]